MVTKEIVIVVKAIYLESNAVIFASVIVAGVVALKVAPVELAEESKE